jgi:hypothetical protein
MKRINLTGQSKNRLTVVGYSHSHVQPSGQKRAVWNVICECGTKKLMSTSTWNSPSTYSCGCYRAEGNNKKEKGVASFNGKYASYKIRAKNHKKQLAFDLSAEEFKNLIIQPCHYCGAKESASHKVKKNANGSFFSNGIDRVDSSIGYVKYNCVPCCTTCNKMKLDLPYDEFINHVKRIYNALAKIEKL